MTNARLGVYIVKEAMGDNYMDIFKERAETGNTRIPGSLMCLEINAFCD